MIFETVITNLMVPDLWRPRSSRDFRHDYNCLCGDHRNGCGVDGPPGQSRRQTAGRECGSFHNPTERELGGRKGTRHGRASRPSMSVCADKLLDTRTGVPGVTGTSNPPWAGRQAARMQSRIRAAVPLRRGPGKPLSNSSPRHGRDALDNPQASARIYSWIPWTRDGRDGELTTTCGLDR